MDTDAPAFIPPGLLAAPLGWAAAPLLGLACREPALLLRLLDMDKQRMHLMAFAVAHQDQALPGFGALLARGSGRAIVEAVLGRRPAGLEGALGKARDAVMSRACYPMLVALLEDPLRAKAVRHAPAISSPWVRGLHQLPREICQSSLLAALGQRLDSAEHIMPTLRHIAAGLGENDAVFLERLGQANSARALVGALRRAVARLPLVIPPPPPRIDAARRLDSALEVKQLARTWQNCLASYVSRIGSRCHVYLWEGKTPALCEVERQGQLGWCLGAVKGPLNVDLPAEALREIHTAFAAAGVPGESGALLINSLIEDDMS